MNLNKRLDRLEKADQPGRALIFVQQQENRNLYKCDGKIFTKAEAEAFIRPDDDVLWINIRDTTSTP